MVGGRGVRDIWVSYTLVADWVLRMMEMKVLRQRSGIIVEGVTEACRKTGDHPRKRKLGTEIIIFFTQ